MTPFRRTIAIKHRAAGSRVDGKYVPGSLTDGTIRASAQPLTPFEVEHLPEGRRTRSPMWLITSSLLNLGSSETPDYVILYGQMFEVESRETWQNNVIPHYKYLVVKVLEA